jgi:hypothetical protein
VYIGFAEANFTFYFCHPFHGEQGRKEGNDSVAQLVEQYTFNVWVLGSNPSGITKEKPRLHAAIGVFLFWLQRKRFGRVTI